MERPLWPTRCLQGGSEAARRGLELVWRLVCGLSHTWRGGSGGLAVCHGLPCLLSPDQSCHGLCQEEKVGSQVRSLNIRSMGPAWHHPAFGHFTPGILKGSQQLDLLTITLFAGWDRRNSIQVLGSCNQRRGSAQVAKVTHHHWVHNVRHAKISKEFQNYSKSFFEIMKLFHN